MNSLCKVLSWPWAKYMTWLDPDGQKEISQDYAAAKLPETDLLDDPEMAYWPLNGDRYKAEQELAEKYRSFVSEILRLSLATLAVFTFLNAYLHKSYWVLSFACLGAALLVVSIGRSLQFLFGASEGLRWYIVGLRYYQEMPGQPATAEQKAKARDILAWRGEIIRRCRIQKQQAAGFLLLGAVVMAIALFISLFVDLPQAAK